MSVFFRLLARPLSTVPLALGGTVLALLVISADGAAPSEDGHGAQRAATTMAWLELGVAALVFCVALIAGQQAASNRNSAGAFTGGGGPSGGMGGFGGMGGMGGMGAMGGGGGFGGTGGGSALGGGSYY